METTAMSRIAAEKTKDGAVWNDRGAARSLPEKFTGSLRAVGVVPSWGLSPNMHMQLLFNSREDYPTSLAVFGH